ncbi:tetratricopeptide repeat protein [Paenibacillus pabuli]|uniref:tetratricopeptide repeat protein n=1 Tax=Paenibacillus pabuli TaxID=1472 RepID=UPI0020005664|nr:tetratricopeptide repeat protein [Paenibacillus pabuli]UPK42551.1 diadenylate cyclase [Paenibacillus pabuli]
MQYTQLEEINTIIYQHIEAILKRLNHRIHFRLYSIAIDENNKADKFHRVKKTISTQAKNDKNSTECTTRYEYVNDPLQEIKQVYNELGLLVQQEDTLTKESLHELIIASKQSYVQQYNEQLHSVPISSGSIEFASKDESAQLTKEYIEDHRLLYAGTFEVSQQTENPYTVIYLLGIRNLEPNVQHTYYSKPEVSFIRMVLDYFFLDFFTEGKLELKLLSENISKYELIRKYQENEVQFLRRINRLFFGKMQMILHQSSSNTVSQYSSNIVKSEYYINNLLENIDDISTQTYEGASPFGSMLFLRNSDIKVKQGPVKFAIEFKTDDLISIEDAKRIRKLLEMTNAKKHLYLISDGNWVYGVGEIQWDKLKETTSFRIDFKGISKYNLVSINFDQSPNVAGELILEGEKTIYRSNTDYELTYQTLVSVMFKNPKIGEEGYTSERMVAILRETFQGEGTLLASDNIPMLEQIIRKAREQRHGTMVVITDSTTAEKELDILRKQSTLIEPCVVHPDHIKFLTAIDGAIYFDTEAKCHAIGVILDGIAQPELGDASRGARFNSAYRYYSKLESEGKKCVIVIISEDGMIDVIPSFDDEEKVLDLVEEIIDVLDQREEPERDLLLQRKEGQLLKLKKTDFQPLMSLAQKFGSKQKYDKAKLYYDEAFGIAGNTFIPAKYHNWRGVCYYHLGLFTDSIVMFETAIEIDQRNDSVYIGNAGGAYLEQAKKSKGSKEENHRWLLKSLSLLEESIDKKMFIQGKDSNMAGLYNDKGICCSQLTKNSMNETEDLKYLEESVAAFSKALEWEPSARVILNNRAGVLEKMDKPLDAVKDYIEGYFVSSEDEERTYNFEKIKSLMESNSNITLDVVNFYRELVQKNKNQIYEKLDNFFSTLESKAQPGLDTQEAAFSSEQNKEL